MCILEKPQSPMECVLRNIAVCASVSNSTWIIVEATQHLGMLKYNFWKMCGTGASIPFLNRNAYGPRDWMELLMFKKLYPNEYKEVYYACDFFLQMFDWWSDSVMFYSIFSADVIANYFSTLSHRGDPHVQTGSSLINRILDHKQEPLVNRRYLHS